MRVAIRACTFVGFIVLAVGVSHARAPNSSRDGAGQPDLSNALPSDVRGEAAAEIATPALNADGPEPKQWMLVLAGLGAIGWIARRRR